MSEDKLVILSSLIGVAGTILGTVLGFVLSRLKFGKIYFYFTHIDHIENGFEYGGKFGDENSPEKLKALNLKFDVRIYNSSDNNDVLHDCEIAFIDDKATLLKYPIGDPLTKLSGSVITTIDNVTALNIFSKTAINIPVERRITEIEKLLKAKEIVLKYKNKYFKNKYITIKKVDFSNIPTYNEPNEE